MRIQKTPKVPKTPKLLKAHQTPNRFKVNDQSLIKKHKCEKCDYETPDKEQYDKQVFDRAVKLAMEGNNGLETHFIYAGEHYLDFSQRIEQLLQFKMRRYKLKSAVLTLINMQRWDVVTKETMVQGYKGRAQQTYIAEILLLKGLPISVLRIFQYTFTNDF